MNKKFCILVVDNDEELSKKTTELLKKDGYKTLQAQNGKVALQIVEDTKPDLVLLDVNLSDLNRMEGCTRIKSSEDKNTLHYRIPFTSTY